MFRNNIEMCENFCESIKDKKISKDIYISSDAVYSDSVKKLNENSQTFELNAWNDAPNQRINLGNIQ